MPSIHFKLNDVGSEDEILFVFYLVLRIQNKGTASLSQIL